jgi:predicted  nucleic acid-binding Zn-ribbon protein
LLRHFQSFPRVVAVLAALSALSAFAADKARQNALQQLESGTPPPGATAPSTAPATPQPPADPATQARERNESSVATYTKDAVAARALWEDHGRKLRQILQQLAGLTKELARLKKDIASARAEHRKLEREKETALEELRRGDFCSGCGDTRSKIEAAGQRFPHEGQVRRPALPADFARLENEFAGRFAALKKKIESLDAQRRQKEPDARDLHSRYLRILPDYHREIARESDLRLRAWNTEKDFLERQLDAATARLTQLRRASGGEAVALEPEIRRVEREFADLYKRAESRFLRAEQDANAYVQAATRDLEHTSSTAEPVEPEAGVPDGWFLSRTILTPPAAVACRVYRIRQYQTPGGANARNLLESGPAKSAAPVAPGPRPSARDLLEGR